MATLVGLGSAQYGIETAETSYEVMQFDVTISPQEKKYFVDRSGSNKGFALVAPRLTISANGYITATTSGFWSYTFTTAITLGNGITYFGVGGTGGVYLDSGTITQAAEDLKRVSMEFSLDAGIA
jgi:hypothetical protein